MHTIKCPNCGEEYAASYKRCPFCAENQPSSRSSNRSGGKRLATNRKKNRFWRRVLFFLSLILIIAAVCIVVSIVKTLFAEKGANVAPDATPSIAVSPTSSSSGTGDGILTGIALDPSEVALAETQDTQQLAVVPSPSNAPADVTWSSSNLSVATVSETGLVTAVGTGSATITATSTVSGSITASCMVTVGSTDTSPAPSGSPGGNLKINKTDFTLFSAGESCQLKITGTSSAVTWSVENSAVATVSENGLVTAVASGMTTVTATVDDQSFSCIVRVK